jgi:hypothetical protein
VNSSQQEKRIHDLELMLYGGEVMAAEAVYGSQLFGHMDGASTRSFSAGPLAAQIAANDPNRVYATVMVNEEPGEIVVHNVL